MAGRPFLAELTRKIEQRGGDDYVFDAIASGVSIGDIAKELGVSRRYLYTWRDQPRHREERKARWAEAMELSAYAKEEEGAKILDDLAAGGLVPTAAEVSLAVSRSKYRQWQAEVRNKEFRPNQGLDVNVKGSVEHLHLDALKRLGGPVKAEELEEGEVVEAELIEEQDDDVVHLLKGA